MRVTKQVTMMKWEVTNIVMMVVYRVDNCNKYVIDSAATYQQRVGSQSTNYQDIDNNSWSLMNTPKPYIHMQN